MPFHCSARLRSKSDAAMESYTDCARSVGWLRPRTCPRMSVSRRPAGFPVVRVHQVCRRSGVAIGSWQWLAGRLVDGEEADEIRRQGGEACNGFLAGGSAGFSGEAHRGFVAVSCRPPSAVTRPVARSRASWFARTVLPCQLAGFALTTVMAGGMRPPRWTEAPLQLRG
jgi:hypothetical protein